jgi:hypothetical protein
MTEEWKRSMMPFDINAYEEIKREVESWVWCAMCGTLEPRERMCGGEYVPITLDLKGWILGWLDEEWGEE